MAYSYISAEEWARRVPSAQPHGLDEVERQVWASARRTIRQASKSSGITLSKLRRGANALIVGPVAAATVFIDSSDASKGFDFEPMVEMVAALIGFVLGAFLQAHLLTSWWRRRHRDGEAIALSVLVLVCAVGTVWQGSTRSVEGAVLYLIPAVVTGLGAAVAIVLHAFSAPAPRTSKQDAEPLRLDHLGEVEQKALLADRNAALEMLQRRDMLQGASADDLARRPLGELNGPEPAQE